MYRILKLYYAITMLLSANILKLARDVNRIFNIKNPLRYGDFLQKNEGFTITKSRLI